MIVWGLFDSGNGCYSKASRDFDEIEMYSVGLDMEKKNSHFIELDLADYKRIFGDNSLFETLDNLPKPDLIIASPPCESWSGACAMKNGNAFWKREDLSDSLFVPQRQASPFTVRTRSDFDSYLYNFEKCMMKRINGELTIFNLIEIIKRYNPGVYVIENPANSKIWEYINDVLGFIIPFKNLTRYNNYDNYPLQKPTRFMSNIYLELDTRKRPGKVKFQNFNKSYNERSNIPLSLIKQIYRVSLKSIDKQRKEK